MTNQLPPLPAWWPPAPGALVYELDAGRGIISDGGSIYWASGDVTYDFADFEEEAQKGSLSLLLG